MEPFVDIYYREWQELGNREPSGLVFLRSVDSTSSDLRRRLENGAPLNTVVAADDQTSGRGRSGNAWHSPPGGNLYISVALDVARPLKENLLLVPLAAGIAAMESLGDCGTCQVKLKWPNDILLGGRKLAGILCELPRPDLWPRRVIVGLGVNICVVDFPVDIRETAISLAGITRRDSIVLPHPATLAARWISQLEKWTSDAVFCQRTLVKEWKMRAESFGRRVRVGDVEGRTVDLTEEGHLVVVRDDGSRSVVAAGIVENMERKE